VFTSCVFSADFFVVVCVHFLCIFKVVLDIRKKRACAAYLNLCLSLSVCVCMLDYNLLRGYGLFSIPFSYDQPDGKGQSLSRRYCKHSV